jgi:hypothetical protein
VVVTSVLVLVLGGAVLLVANAGREPPEPVLGSVALGCVVAGPGVLGLLGLADRPTLWLGAAGAALPLSLLSMAGLALPLFPAAVVYLLAWARHPPAPSAARGSVVGPTVVALAVAVALVAGAVALFLTEDPASWTTPTGGGSTSDVISTREAVLSLALTLAGLAAGWLLVRPRPAAT